MKPNDNNVVDSFAWNLAYLLGHLTRQANLDPKLKSALETITDQANYVETLNSGEDMLGFAAKYIGEMQTEEGDNRDLLDIIR